jgi:anti-sigma-K factor RskA
VVRMRQTTVTEVAVLNDDGLPNRSNVRGRAELVDDAGRQVLDVEVPDLPAAPNGQAFEVWLLAADGGLQSLGLIEHTGRFAVPAGVDLTRFNVVDVSREPIDGNPTHSGDSVVRGTLVPR